MSSNSNSTPNPNSNSNSNSNPNSNSNSNSNPNPNSNSNSNRTSPRNPPGLRTHAGGCLCGAVRFEVDLDLAAGATRCNCTICTKLGATGVPVKPAALRLLAGEASLGAWGKPGSPNRRFFCRECGTYLFGRGDVPELGGAFASANVNALDGVDVGALSIRYWDGRHDNWAAGTRPEPWPV